MDLRLHVLVHCQAFGIHGFFRIVCHDVELGGNGAADEDMDAERRPALKKSRGTRAGHDGKQAVWCFGETSGAKGGLAYVGWKEGDQQRPQRGGRSLLVGRLEVWVLTQQRAAVGEGWWGLEGDSVGDGVGVVGRAYGGRWCGSVKL